MDFTRLLPAAVACGGLTVAAVLCINRIHGRAWRCRTLARAKNAVIAIWAGSCLAAAGWMLLGDASTAAVLTVACLLGLPWLAAAAAVVRHWRTQGPLRDDGVVLQRVDLRTDAAVEVGDASLAWLARVPGNELLQFELTGKAIPVQSSRTRSLHVLHLTDWHFSGTPGRVFYERATELAAAAIDEYGVELVVFSGDLVDRMSLLPWVETTLARIDAPAGRVFVLGNHDWMQRPSEIRTHLTAAGWTDIAGRVVTLATAGGPVLVGGSERPWMGEEPTFPQDNSEALRLAVMHTPDRLPWAASNGCDAALAGHNHGGQVRLPLLGPVLAPSLEGTRFAGGLYAEQSPPLHVGRGLGALHPLRWRCRPEMTLLTIVPTQGEPGRTRDSTHSEGSPAATT